MIKYNFFGKVKLFSENPETQKQLFDKFLAEISTNQAFSRQNLSRPLNLLLLKQIHGKEVFVVDSSEKIFSFQNRPQADGIVCSHANIAQNIALGILTADCSPVLFFDEETKVIGACHAGWKGAKAGIIEETVAAMKRLGAEKIHAVIGPMISKDFYQITGEFLENFLDEDSENQRFFSEFSSEKISEKKWLFDFPAYVEKRLQGANIASIKNLRIDTFSNPEKFASYRRRCLLGEKYKYNETNVAVLAIASPQT